MTNNKTSFQVFICSLFILVAMVLASENAMSAQAPNKLDIKSHIICDSAFGEKSFTISNESIAFHDVKGATLSRKISSLVGIKKVRTHVTLNGFTKVLYKNGNKHKIHINNSANFNEVEDYMTIVSPKGHKVTYPLNCSI
ncbi:MAG: hypothetical protein ACI9QD_000588 [Thermoproteota archaeon]|jgi:hypothetical protein